MALNGLNELYQKSQFLWKFKDFFALAKDRSATLFHDSPEFAFAGASWQFHMAKRPRERLFDVYIALVDGNEEYTLDCQFGIKRGDGHVVQLETGTFLFSNDRLARKTKLKGLRSSARIGYLLVHQLEQQREDLVPSDVLTIVATLRRKTEDLPQMSIQVQNKELVDPKTLSEDLIDLFKNKDNGDTTLQVKDKEYKVHRAVLMARSRVFAAMFTHETTERQTGIVSITDCDPESFEQFLLYIYSGKLEEPSFENAMSLYETSEKYDVQELKAFCSKYLVSHLTENNFFDFLMVADKYGDHYLCSAAQKFFKKNSSSIESTSEWKFLLRCNGLASQLNSEISVKEKCVY